MKNLKIIIITIALMISIKLFGYKLVTIYFNNFQEKICINNTCINKVKDLIPIYVKKDNKIFIFNFINEDYVPFKLFEQIFKDYKNAIFLGNKDLKGIIVLFDINNKFLNKSLLKKYTFENKTYYVEELSSTYKIFYPEKNLYITFLKGKDEIEFFKSFLQIN